MPSGRNSPLMRSSSNRNRGQRGLYESEVLGSGHLSRSGLNYYEYDDDQVYLREKNNVCRSSWSKFNMGKNRRVNFNMNNAQRKSHYKKGHFED